MSPQVEAAIIARGDGARAVPGHPGCGCPSYRLFRQLVRGVTAIHEPNQAQRADLAVLAPGTRSHERGRGMIRMRVAYRS